jgi:hypothetical protein
MKRRRRGSTYVVACDPLERLTQTVFGLRYSGVDASESTIRKDAGTSELLHGTPSLALSTYVLRSHLASRDPPLTASGRAHRQHAVHPTERGARRRWRVRRVRRAPSATRSSTTPSRCGSGKRIDGLANRDLKVGTVIASAPNPRPLVDVLRLAPLGAALTAREFDVADPREPRPETRDCCPADFVPSCRSTHRPAEGTPAQLLEMTSPDGAIGDWPDASAVDHVGVVTPSYVPARGTLLGPGAHAVVASASDAAGNAASCGFTVTVRDTTAPAITCPADVLATAPGPDGVAVTFPPPLASDAATPAAVVVLDHVSGEVFPVGVTTLRATARDAAGNVGGCSFRVEVRVATSSSDAPPGAAGTSEASGSPASSSGCSTAASEPTALLTPLAALAVRRRRSSRAHSPVRRQRCEMA